MNITFRRRPSELAQNGACATGPIGLPLSQFFNDAFFGDPFGGVLTPPTTAMPLDVAETETAFIVRADVPGFRKDQVSIEIEKGVLTLRAEATEEKTESEPEHRYHRRERRLESVTRRIALPEGVQEDGITADLADGVLSVTLPKAPQAQPRKVTIK